MAKLEVNLKPKTTRKLRREPSHFHLVFAVRILSSSLLFFLFPVHFGFPRHVTELSHGEGQQGQPGLGSLVEPAEFSTMQPSISAGESRIVLTEKIVN